MRYVRKMNFIPYFQHLATVWGGSESRVGSCYDLMEESCPFPPLQSLCELLGTATFLVSLQGPARQAMPSPGDGGTGKWMPFPSGKHVPWSGFLHLHHGTAMTPGCQHHPTQQPTHHHHPSFGKSGPATLLLSLPQCSCTCTSSLPRCCAVAASCLVSFLLWFFFSSDNALTTHRKKSRSFPRKSQ